ncbi:MAG: hypothetical protein NT018_01955 [Armatimonadetes bacterium]|nr:hypothetical protein [Armatimonadota bacterium]
MANKKTKTKKAKQPKIAGQKSGSMDFTEFGSSQPPKQKKKKQSQ